jgi:membrane dipeptidase
VNDQLGAALQFPWFDAHLDLAYLAGRGRDMQAMPEQCGGPHPPAAVTLPSLREGGVRWVLGTIYTEAGGALPEGYDPEDREGAHKAGVRQLDWYRRERDAGEFCALATADPEDVAAPLGLGLLMENADPIRKPEELEWWAARGVSAVGLAWVKPSRYAGGNGGGAGLTSAGRELVLAMREAGVLPDLAHLSQQAVEELLDMHPGRVIASHSNCRALLGGEENPNWQRHLSDETIVEIGRRGGMIGLNLYAPFLRHGLAVGERPTLCDAVAHLERICELQGHRRGVGLGSDMDGGLSAREMCAEIERPAHLVRLLEALGGAGWSEAELLDFTHRNWLRFWCTAAAATDFETTQRTQA